MKLNQYKHKHKLYNHELAKMFGVTIVTISNWLNGKIIPSFKSQKIVQQKTKGEVDFEDWEDVTSVNATRTIVAEKQPAADLIDHNKAVSCQNDIITPKNSLLPDDINLFKLSRSKIDLFLQCPLCFYLDRKLGISQPSGPPFTLNNMVDSLLKKEFDFYREKKCLHPFQIDNGINSIPYSHDDLEKWRNNKEGIRYHHKATSLLIYGAIDDVWQAPDGELFIVDYKAKASTDDPSTFLEPKRKKNGEIVKTEQYKISYKKQIEIYQWLFRKNGFRVSNTAYFVFANVLKNQNSFNDQLNFEKTLISYEGDDSWVEQTIQAIFECLNTGELPGPASDCDFCKYRTSGYKVENIKEYNDEKLGRYCE